MTRAAREEKKGENSLQFGEREYAELHSERRERTTNESHLSSGFGALTALPPLPPRKIPNTEIIAVKTR
jgi:hypothetical protein